MAEIAIAGRETPSGLSLVTRGLAAHGLPELRIEALPPYLGQAWARLLAVLAQRLAQHPEALLDEIILTPYDIAAVLGGDPAEGADVRIALNEADGHLEPHPPPGSEEKTQDWRRETVLKLLPAARS